MAVENATVISELDLTSFSNTSPGHETDDQVNVCKSVLKNQFPGVGGDGFAVPIDSTEAELNYLQGVTGPIQPQLDVSLGQRIPTVASAVAGNIAIWDTAGNVIDSGVSMQTILDRLNALEAG